MGNFYFSICISFSALSRRGSPPNPISSGGINSVEGERGEEGEFSKGREREDQPWRSETSELN